MDRTRPPIMTDAIMYYNEARPPTNFQRPYAPQPAAANIGLDFVRNPVRPYNSPNFDLDGCHQQVATPHIPCTVMHNDPKGYSHTGASLPVNYRHTPLDPRYELSRYGNTKPQLLRYTTESSNSIW